jgi:hypothetical protein
VINCAAPLAAAQTPKTAYTFATLPVAAMPRAIAAIAARALVAAPVSRTWRAEPCAVRASISDAIPSISDR